MELGAAGGARYDLEGWRKKLPRDFNVIIDSAGGQDFGELIKLLGMGGRICFFGGTKGAWPAILPQRLFFKQISIHSSTMGSPREFKALCDFVSEKRLVPIIDSVFPLEEAASAMERLLHKERFGKVVLSVR